MILLVNPNNRVTSPFAGLEEPLWLSLIASDLISKGEEVMILDAEALDMTVQETCNSIRTLRPKETILVCMGSNPSVTSTPKMVVVKKIVDNLIGEFDIKVTGLHPTALPRETKSELGVEVLRGKIFDGTPDIPFQLFSMNEYIAHVWQCLDGSPRKPYAVTYTRLGCGSGCSFCNVSAQYGFQNKVWYRETESFIKEVDLLVNKYRVRTLKLWDEHFTGNHARVAEICDKLIERNYDLNIWAYARVDSINPRILEKIRKAGIKWLAVGFESGSDVVLSNVSKRANSNQAVNAVKMIHDADINIIGNFIFGLPSDTQETMQQTSDFARSLNIEFANMYIYHPYPGSKLWNESSSYQWWKYGQFSPFQSEAMKFKDKAFEDYFTDPNYLSHVKKRFGEQAVGTIVEMVSLGKPVTRC